MIEEKIKLKERENKLINYLFAFPHNEITKMKEITLLYKIFGKIDEEDKLIYKNMRKKALESGVISESYLEKIVPDLFKEEIK
ncbi:MAG: hypothetical protein AABW81_02065 [Nanoarchaeota archaeon]